MSRKKGKLYKSVSFMFFLAVFISLIIVLSNLPYFKFNLFQSEVQYSGSTDIGLGTFENIKNNIVKLSCDDAKAVSKLYLFNIKNKMFSNVTDNVSVNDIYNIVDEIDNNERMLSDFYSNFKIFLGNMYGMDKEGVKKSSEIFYEVIDDINSNIIVLSYLYSLNKISENDISKFIDINYCNGVIEESYVSPVEIYYKMINK